MIGTYLNWCRTYLYERSSGVWLFGVFLLVCWCLILPSLNCIRIGGSELGLNFVLM